MTIEVEPTLFGNPILDAVPLLYQRATINQHFTKITDALAGLLCTEHVELPALKEMYSEGRWIIEVKCCCPEHMERIEKRLDEKYT